MKDKYMKLAIALTAAAYEGESAENECADGFPCNFDSVYIHLPRWNTKQVEEAAKVACVRCYKDGTVWMFIPRTRGMGTKRTVNAETMARVLKGNGFDAGVWYHLD